MTTRTREGRAGFENGNACEAAADRQDRMRAAVAEPESRGRIVAVKAAIAAGLIEREDEVDLTFAALVAGEHVLLVGPPGVGKSMLFDSLVRAMDGATFSILLTKFTTPEEVMGPLSLSALREDRHARVTKNRLPEASVAFIDETFKASSSILNTLLRLLNEGVYEQDGRWERSPLHLCVGASNEWPNSEHGGAELAALFDRFLIRKLVRPIRSPKAQERLLFGADVGPVLPDAPIEPVDVATARVASRRLPWAETAKEALRSILSDLAREGITPSDRRKRKAIGICQAVAWLDAAPEVQPHHLEILSHVLWDDPREQPIKAAEVVGRHANPVGQKITQYLVEADEILAGTDVRNAAQATVAISKLGEITRKLKELGASPKVQKAVDYVASENKSLRLRFVERDA